MAQFIGDMADKLLEDYTVAEVLYDQRKPGVVRVIVTMEHMLVAHLRVIEVDPDLQTRIYSEDVDRVLRAEIKYPARRIPWFKMTLNPWHETDLVGWLSVVKWALDGIPTGIDPLDMFGVLNKMQADFDLLGATG
jgi:hypothetical protein